MNTATPLFLLVLAYVLAVAAAGWHFLSSNRRTFLHERIRSGAAWAGAFAKYFIGMPLAAWRAVVAATACATAFAAEAAWRKRQVLAAGLVLLAAPVSLLLAFVNVSRLQPYDDMASRRDPVVASLLDGEQLVPPAPLPPEVFASREAGADRMELATASREWMMLDPDFRQRLLLVFRAMESHGYRMVLLEGYRSPERQQMLAQLGPQVTNAKAFQSYHQFGLAADSAFYRNGRLVISEKDAWAMEGYRLYGDYAESFGLTWGGRWQMRDYGHVELRRARASP